MLVVPFWNRRTNEETSLGMAGPNAVDMQFNTLKNLEVFGMRAWLRLRLGGGIAVEGRFQAAVARQALTDLGGCGLYQIGEGYEYESPANSSILNPSFAIGVFTSGWKN
jgi:hypothetical protein